MNVNLPEKEKVSRKRIIIYTTVAIICIFAIIIAVGVQILGEDVVNTMFGINRLVKRTEQEETVLKANFESIFDNKIDSKKEYNNIQMVDENKELLYTGYEVKEKTDNYEININIPYINIVNSEVQKFNKEISETYEAKAEEVISGTEENTIYTVKYKANIESNILSLIIYSDLKQGTDAQRVIIQTFNFDLENKKKIGIDEVIKKYDLNKSEIQGKINQDIQKLEKRYNELKSLGYNVFSRNAKSNIYKVENIEEFFIYNSNIYIIFAYGNEELTSERDIVII